MSTALDRRILSRLCLGILDLLENLAHARVHERAALSVQIVVSTTDALGLAGIDLVGHGSDLWLRREGRSILRGGMHACILDHRRA